MVSPLHPGHPRVGMPPVYSPRNLAAPIATSIMASLTRISSPHAGQRYRYSSGGGPNGSSRAAGGSGSGRLRRIFPPFNPTATSIFDLRTATRYAPPAYPMDHQEAPYVTSLSDRR